MTLPHQKLISQNILFTLNSLFLTLSKKRGENERDKEKERERMGERGKQKEREREEIMGGSERDIWKNRKMTQKGTP